MNPIDNPPVFPICFNGHNKVNEGILLRDWLAGQALAGLLGDPNRSGSFEAFAKDAYKHADALLAAVCPASRMLSARSWKTSKRPSRCTTAITTS